MISLHIPERPQVSMKTCDESRNGGDGFKTDSMMVVFLSKEGVDKDSKELHDPVGGAVDKVLGLIMIRDADLLEVGHGKTGRKRLRLVCQLLVATVRLRN